MLTIIIVAGCGGGASASPSAASPSSAGGATVVDVDLQEWAVAPSTTSAAAGDVTFKATNKGPDDEHELVVARTDLAPDALPTKADGAVDEAGAGVTVIDEIEEFAVGGTEEATMTLEAGAYVLFCNIVDAEGDAHYSKGMRTAFTVN
jgi:uncharacterized cupredoxin-like copper-binding protein